MTVVRAGMTAPRFPLSAHPELVEGWAEGRPVQDGRMGGGRRIYSAHPELAEGRTPYRRVRRMVFWQVAVYCRIL